MIFDKQSIKQVNFVNRKYVVKKDTITNNLCN